MKKLVLTMIAIATFSLYASAQLSVGVKGGLNLANFGGDAEDTDMRPSIHLGGYVNFAFSEQLSLQPELLYNSVGAKFSEGDVEETFKLNYISVPVMVKYSFGGFNVQAGPQLGFLASAKYDWEEGGDSGDEDIKDAFKGTDLSFNIGVGADFGKLNATARYVIGLSNVNDGEGDLTNNVIQLSLGYTLFGGE